MHDIKRYHDVNHTVASIDLLNLYYPRKMFNSSLPMESPNFRQARRKLTSAVLIAQIREPPHIGQVHGESNDRHQEIRFVRPLFPARSPAALHHNRRRRRIASVTTAILVVHDDHCNRPPDSTTAELTARSPVRHKFIKKKIILICSLHCYRLKTLTHFFSFL